jgi:hypothetical protein
VRLLARPRDLPSIRELVDRLDGRPAQTIDRYDVLVTELSDGELYLSASGARAGHEPEMKVVPVGNLIRLVREAESRNASSWYGARSSSCWKALSSFKTSWNDG